jgi:hypothetical protein
MRRNTAEVSMVQPQPIADPTRTQFEAYSLAFDHFNQAIFGNELPRCIITFNRPSRAHGFFAPLRWTRPDGRTHEISLKPDVLSRPIEDAMSTLVHAMVHLWQQEHGNAGRAGYHNREWAAKMEAVGLMPTATGEPRGKRTGLRVTHSIIDGGPFRRAVARMSSECLLPWLSTARDDGGMPRKPRPDKVKYTCPGCGVNLWGRAGLSIECGDCRESFEADVWALPRWARPEQASSPAGAISCAAPEPLCAP